MIVLHIDDGLVDEINSCSPDRGEYVAVYVNPQTGRVWGRKRSAGSLEARLRLDEEGEPDECVMYYPVVTDAGDYIPESADSLLGDVHYYLLGLDKNR